MKHSWLVMMAAACGADDAPVDPQSCAAYVRPPRAASVGCADPSDPFMLVPCDTGSALAGAWTIDPDGLPAYDLLVDERCDDAATAYSPRRADRQIRDPWHVVGDGYGMVAMAHASGGFDVYMQDRGHSWPVHVDTWRDEQHPEFPPQLGAALGYLVEDGRVQSLRFEDLPVADALAAQQRRFGVGYAETTTSIDELVITRRVYALAGSRALVTEVTIENRAPRDRTVGLVELDDINMFQLPMELATSDLLAPAITIDIDRRRRDLAAEFHHRARYDAAARTASITTEANAPTVGPDDTAPYDQYPATLWLAALDATPDAAWLADGELWPDAERTPPAQLAGGDASDRALALPGANQPGVLALRVPVTLAAGERVVRRFAFGEVPQGGDVVAAADAVRAAAPDAHAAAAAWKPRLVWAAVPGQPHAGALQRELAWSSYAMQALATYDAYHRARLLGQGGSYKYIHGIDGAIGDYALFADAALAIDPALAADTLALSFATQRAASAKDHGRYPYATTGVGSFTDVVRYDLRSDAYFLMPSLVGRYVALTRDTAFLDRDVPYWPRAAGDSGSVLDHLQRTQTFADTTLGVGAHGIVAMGTNDYNDGILQTATEPATPTGTSSTYNAWLLVAGYPLAADVVAPRDAALAQRYRDERTDQLARLEQFAWNGMWYERGFVDSGNPLDPGDLYLEPQVLPIVAGAIDPARRDALLALVAQNMDTPIGPMTLVPIAAGGDAGGTDERQVYGVWPVVSPWLTEAYAIADPARGWDSLVRNTLFAHAEAFPRLWYGVWSGPDSYYGPDAERPGEADAHLATALTDYPVLDVHAHASVLRALFAVAGIEPTAAGIAIAPRLPTETFAIAWPRIALTSTPSSIAGSLTTVGGGPLELRVRLPSDLRGAGPLDVRAGGAPVTATRDGDDVVLTVVTAPEVPLAWSVNAARPLQ